MATATMRPLNRRRAEVLNNGRLEKSIMESEEIVKSVSVANIKTVAEMPAGLANLALANAVSFQQMANNGLLSLMQATNARAVTHVLDTDISDAAAVQKISSGNDLGQQLAQLGTVIAQIQQSIKGAQTTVPVTP